MPFGDSTQAGYRPQPGSWKETRAAMAMVAEVVDAVVGGDTHKDTHALEMVAASGVTISTTTISNTAEGYAAALAWLAEHAPGAELVVGWRAPAPMASDWPAP